MKRIAIFCDGTWNLTDRRDRQTNVVRLAQAVRHEADDGVKQIPIYVRGVGTGTGSNAVARTTDKWLGGALGWGLERNIVEAYKALIWTYEPSDELFIFGFSRGAYTARSLAGLIRKSGIPSRDNIDKVDEAMALYRKRGKSNHPDSDKVQAERARLSTRVATSQDDLDKREDGAELLRITYLGVLDTVGALGLPGFMGLLAKVTNQKYAFHDMDLSSSVKSARHAVALDERRSHYPASLWSNMDDLNARFPRDTPDKAPFYQQKWFAGDHGSIGGGGAERGLSAYTYSWLADGAEACGLALDPKRLADAVAEQNCGAPVYNTPPSKLKLWATAPVSADREGPEVASDVHPSVLDRIRLGVTASGGKYQPGSLARVWDDLPGLLPSRGVAEEAEPEEDDDEAPQTS